jgi:hypothetical protein
VVPRFTCVKDVEFPTPTALNKENTAVPARRELEQLFFAGQALIFHASDILAKSTISTLCCLLRFSSRFAVSF